MNDKQEQAAMNTALEGCKAVARNEAVERVQTEAPEPIMVDTIDLLIFGEGAVIIAEAHCDAMEHLVMQHGRPELLEIDLSEEMDLNDRMAVSILVSRFSIEYRKSQSVQRFEAFRDNLPRGGSMTADLAKNALDFGLAISGSKEYTMECMAYADIFVKARQAVGSLIEPSAVAEGDE